MQAVTREKMKSKEYYVFLICKMFIKRLQVYLAAFSYMFCASRVPPQLKSFDFLNHEAHLEEQREVLIDRMV